MCQRILYDLRQTSFGNFTTDQMSLKILRAKMHFQGIGMQRFNANKKVRSVLSFSFLIDAQMKGVACTQFDSQPSCRKSKI